MAIWVNWPVGGLDWPYQSEPQQITSCAWLSAQECSAALATAVKRPTGDWRSPSSKDPQHEIVPTVSIPQAWLLPTDTDA